MGHGDMPNMAGAHNEPEKRGRSETSNTEALAEVLHAAWKDYRLRTFNVAEPLWWALADEYKAPFRDLAARLLTEVRER